MRCVAITAKGERCSFPGGYDGGICGVHWGTQLLPRAQAEVYALQRENEELRAEIRQLKGESDPSDELPEDPAEWLARLGMEQDDND